MSYFVAGRSEGKKYRKQMGCQSDGEQRDKYKLTAQEK